MAASNLDKPILQEWEGVPEFFKGKVILVTGGTGSFGRAFIHKVLDFSPKKVIIFSRDEFKQHLFKQDYPNRSELRFFLGDVRDYDRLLDALFQVDIVVHAAALKQVDTLEYNPFEAVKTNVHGAENVIRAAVHCQVKHVLALSTDKAVAPTNLYGATKLCAEKLFLSANQMYAYKTLFSVVRYGNVFGSRGSVAPLFRDQMKQDFLTITDSEMTRFNLVLPEAVNFVLNSLLTMTGGEVFIPKLPSYKLQHLIDIIKEEKPEIAVRMIGHRPGEKLHEVMFTETEAPLVYDLGSYFILVPKHLPETLEKVQKRGGKEIEPNPYASGPDNVWVPKDRLKELLLSLP